MALDLSQDNRRGKVFSALGENELGLIRFDGTDGVNELFEYRVEAVTANENINFDAILGTNMTVEIDSRGSKNYFDGIVVEAQWVGVRSDGLHYRFTLRPWIWLASQRRDQRIFKEKSAPEIIRAVLSEYNTDIAEKLNGSYDILHYTVQYRETDLSFVRRLMERYGINFTFAHEKGKHILQLVDENDQFPDIGEREYIPTQGAYEADEHFWAFGQKRQVATAGIAIEGYDFVNPTGKMDHRRTDVADHAYGGIVTYDYPGRHTNEAGAIAETDVRLRQERIRDIHFVGQGHVEALKSGMRVTLGGNHPADLSGASYVCVRAHHVYVGESFGSGNRAVQKESFQGRYEFIGASTSCVPQRTTYDMRMPGPQTATVVGDDPEIDVDEHGRILVEFHWDTESARSMRCRVAQMWAGNKWGTVFTPRIGMEVVVNFIEGDPDQPLVVGCVYNGDNTHPYPMPDKKNLSGFKSDTTTGGDGYNEYVFDDTKQKELIRQHAQKDMETKVLNDERREVDRDRTTTIGRNEKRTVKKNEAHEIKGNTSYTIHGAEDHMVKGNRTTTIDGKEKLTVKGKTSIKCDSEILIESKQKLTLKVGKSTIVMDPMDIKISAGMNLNQEAVMVDIKGKASLKTNGAATAEHSAGAMMTIKGALVKIN